MYKHIIRRLDELSQLLSQLRIGGIGGLGVDDVKSKVRLHIEPLVAAAKDDIRQMGFECYLKTEPLTAHNDKIVEYTNKNKLQATVSDALSTAFGRRMSASD